MPHARKLEQNYYLFDTLSARFRWINSVVFFELASLKPFAKLPRPRDVELLRWNWEHCQIDLEASWSFPEGPIRNQVDSKWDNNWEIGPWQNSAPYGLKL